MEIDWALLSKACALAFILEGMVVFIAPAAYRTVMRQLTQWEDNRLRLIGFCSMALGLFFLFITSL